MRVAIEWGLGGAIAILIAASWLVREAARLYPGWTAVIFGTIAVLFWMLFLLLMN